MVGFMGNTFATSAYIAAPHQRVIDYLADPRTGPVRQREPAARPHTPAADNDL